MPDKIDQINKLIKTLPLPKKGLYKLKDNINLDDYIAILQSKRENKTYTIDASELGGSGTGIQSLTAGDNITIDDTDPLNPIVSAIGGSPALLPNGIKQVGVSRDLTTDDVGYLLSLAADVIVQPAEGITLAEGDIIGITGTLTSSFKIENDASLAVHMLSDTFYQNEIVILSATNADGLETILVPISTTLIADGDVYKTALRYLYDQSQNAIPLSGTEVGKPVTGDIVFQNGMSIYSNNGNGNIGNLIGFKSDRIFLSDYDDIYTGELGVKKEGIYVSSEDPLSKGISGVQDFTPNITDLDYTQKIYVDSAVNAIRPYKVYTAIITQTGTDAPTAVVLQNTLGITPTLTRFATGNYRITASNTFTANKTFCIVGQEANSGTGMNYIWASDSNDDEVLLQTYDGAGLGAALTDDKMDRLSVEIRVYK